MKKIIVMLIALGLVSCNGKDAAMREFSGDESQFTKGQWHIKAFMFGGRQAGSDYVAYIFTFTEDGHIIATNSNHSYKGNWSVIWEEGSDDEPPTDIYFVISFKEPNVLAALNGEWIVTEKERSYLRLSLSNDYYDNLAFEKI